MYLHEYLQLHGHVRGLYDIQLLTLFYRCRLEDTNYHCFVCAKCQGVFTDPPTVEGFDMDDGDLLCRK